MRAAKLRREDSLQHVLRLAELDAGEGDRADFRQRDFARRIDGPRQRLRDAAPDRDGEPIAGAEHVVGADGEIERGSLRRRRSGLPHRTAADKHIRPEAREGLLLRGHLGVEVVQCEQIVGRRFVQQLGAGVGLGAVFIGLRRPPRQCRKALLAAVLALRLLGCVQTALLRRELQTVQLLRQVDVRIGRVGAIDGGESIRISAEKSRA